MERWKKNGMKWTNEATAVVTAPPRWGEFTLEDRRVWKAFKEKKGKTVRKKNNNFCIVDKVKPKTENI